MKLHQPILEIYQVVYFLYLWNYINSHIFANYIYKPHIMLKPKAAAGSYSGKKVLWNLWSKPLKNTCEESLSVSVTSGVPQGTVLRPLLFLIYINDLPNSVSSSISLFADDSYVYRRIRNTSGADIGYVKSVNWHTFHWTDTTICVCKMLQTSAHWETLIINIKGSIIPLV